jgi:RecB family endonuclease NucS
MLRKTADRWEFESELALENFVWANLEVLFGFTPLDRQYCSNGEFCDILALDKESRLVIIELKNSEDRYIVQQLTRYYDSIIQDQPFSSQVDYQQSILLVAITPSFHRHNLVDRKYSKLKFDFLSFNVIHIQDEFYLSLTNIDNSEMFKIKIPYQKVGDSEWSEELPCPPQNFLEHLGAYSKEDRQAILMIRQKLLSFDQRMKEIVTAKSIQYGRGKNKCCAEFYFDKKQLSLILFLWLPLWRRRKPAMGRYRIWTDWKTVLYLAHIPEGLGLARPQVEWNAIPEEAWPRKYLHGGRKVLIANPFHGNIARAMGYKDETNSLTRLVDVALSCWHKKL